MFLSVLLAVSHPLLQPQPLAESSLQAAHESRIGVAKATGTSEPASPVGYPVRAWSQFHGNESHDGLSAWTGPTNPQVAWTTDVGFSIAGLTVADGNLVVAPGTGSCPLGGGCSDSAVVFLSETNGEQTEALSYDSGCESSYVTTPYVPIGVGEAFFAVDDPGQCFYSGYYNLEAYGVASGSNLWTAGAPGGATSPYYGQTLLTYSDGYVFADGFESVGLSAYLASSGEDLWSGLSKSGSIDTIPTVGGGLVVVGFSNLQNISAIYELNGTGAWNRSFTSGYDVSAPAFANETFFFGTTGSELMAVSLNGSLRWATGLGAAVEATPAVANGLVVVGTVGGGLYGLNSTSGNIEWQTNLGGPIISSPAVASNGVVYALTTSGTVDALNLSTGVVIWNLTYSSPITATPALDNGYLFFVLQNGTVYAISQAPTRYSLTFNETGLPLGTNWSVTVDSTGKYSSSALISFSETKGIYNFSVGELLGYLADPPAGTVTISDANQTISIIFQQGWSLPSAPTDLVARPSVGSILLNWTGPLDTGAPPGFSGSGIEQYDIYRSLTPGSEAYYAEVPGNQSYFIDDSVGSDTVYFYVVTAVNPVGQSGFSNQASAEPILVTIPTPPVNLTGTTNGVSIVLAWTAPLADGGSPISGYVLYRGVNPGAEGVRTTLPPNETGYIDTSLTGGQTYYYYVVAENSAGQSSPSNVLVIVAPVSASFSSPPWYDVGFWQAIGGLGTFILIVLGVSTIVALYVVERYVRKR